MEASSAKPIVEFVSCERPTIEVFASERRETPISPLLYGKFTEHLGANVYHGVWAQLLLNSGFEPASYFSHRDEEARRQWLAFVGIHRGVPDLRESYEAGTAYFWARWGEGQVVYSADADRVNSDTSQKIELRNLSTDEVGILQPIFLPTHRTGKYEFSVWAKGSAKRLHVAIRTTDGKELGGAEITGLTSEWKRHKAQIEIDRQGIEPGQSLLLTLGVTEPGTVWLDQCLLFPADHVQGFDPDVVRLLKESKLPLLRFPGGNFASRYHWKDGIGPVNERPIRHNADWNQDEPNHVGTDEWLAFCKLVGCEALICVNAGNGTPGEAADWVEYCNGDVATKYGALRAKNGHPEPYEVKYWEIGNELYGSWQAGHCSAEEYAERYARFYEAMHARDPNILFIANGFDAEWNRQVIKRDAGILRSLSVHTLIGGPIPGETSPEAVFRSLMAYPTWYEGHLRYLGSQMADKGIAPRLAISELQIFTKKAELPTNQYLSEALFYAGIVNTAVRLGDLVELITHSALMNHGGGLVKQREVIFANPVYWARHMYSTQSGRWPVRVRMSGPKFSVPPLHDLPAAENAPYLDVVALLDDSGKELNLLVTNRHPKDALTVEIKLEDFAAEPEVLVRTLRGDSYMARNSFDRRDEVKPTESAAKSTPNGMTYTFPACSLTCLRFRTEQAVP